MRKRLTSKKAIINVFLEGRAALPFDGITRRRIKSSAERACEMAGVSGTSMSVILTDDDRITAINKRYRNRNRPTDVISFVYSEAPLPSVHGIPETLGYIYISLERAERQAERYDAGPAEELLRLLVHGILHLAGYDHERSKLDETIMREKEIEMLRPLTRRLSSRSNPT